MQDRQGPRELPADRNHVRGPEVTSARREKSPARLPGDQRHGDEGLLLALAPTCGSRPAPAARGAARRSAPAPRGRSGRTPRGRLDRPRAEQLECDVPGRVAMIGPVHLGLRPGAAQLEQLVAAIEQVGRRRPPCGSHEWSRGGAEIPRPWRSDPRASIASAVATSASSSGGTPQAGRTSTHPPGLEQVRHLAGAQQVDRHAEREGVEARVRVHARRLRRVEPGRPHDQARSPSGAAPRAQTHRSGPAASRAPWRSPGQSA
jgi:hypothetical protein